MLSFVVLCSVCVALCVHAIAWEAVALSMCGSDLQCAFIHEFKIEFFVI